MDILHPLQNAVQAVSRNGSCVGHWWWRLAATLCPRATARADRISDRCCQNFRRHCVDAIVQVCPLFAIRMRMLEGLF